MTELSWLGNLLCHGDGVCVCSQQVADVQENTLGYIPSLCLHYHSCLALATSSDYAKCDLLWLS